MLSTSERPAGRRRSYITFPEYRLGVAPANKGRKFPAEVLTRAECQRLLAACSNRGATGVRNRALITVYWRAGLRCVEALQLRPKDVDLDQHTIRVLHGKGDKDRTLGLDVEACAIVERWVRRRREIAGLPRDAPLFCTISAPAPGRRLWDSYVRELCKELGARASIDKRVHPHGLRHTFAYELICEGVPLPLVQAALGHRDLATTARYVSHFAPADLMRAMAARTWDGQPPPAVAPAA